MGKTMTSLMGKTRQFFFGQAPPLELNPKMDLADLAMILFMAQRLVTYLFSSLLGVKGIVLFMGLLALLYLLVVIQRWREGDRQALYLVLIVLFFLLTSVLVAMLRNPSLKFWVLGSEWNLLTQLADPRKALFGFFLVLLVRDREKIFRNIYWASLAMFAYLVYQALLYEYFNSWKAYFSLVDGKSSYNMSYGYEMILVALVFLAVAMARRSIRLLLLSGLAAGMAIFYGSRGVILPLAAFAFLFLCFWSGGSWKIKKENLKIKARHLVALAAMVLVLVMTIVLIVPLTRSLVDWIQPTYMTPEGELVLKPDDDESRTVQTIVDGEFFEPSGRLTIWKLSLRAFADSPILGQGVFGDRAFVGQNFVWGYSHNVILEMMSQFGLLGLAFILAYIFYAARLMIRESKPQKKLLYILLVAMCAKLLVSDSYLFNEHFWMLSGLLVLELDFYPRLNRKVRLGAFAALFMASLVAFGLFIREDMSRQHYKTIEIEKPSLLFISVGSNKRNLYIQRILEDYGFTAVNLVNAAQIELAESDEEQTKASLAALKNKDMQKLLAKGWTFEDGGYRYENPYIRTPKNQEENREGTLAYFQAQGLGQPVAYRPPYNAHNSTVQYRVMDDYGFIQKLRNASNARPYKTIRYPQALAMEAVRAEWKTSKGWKDLTGYLTKARDQGALAILYVDSANPDLRQLLQVAQTARDLGFESISYRDLYQAGYQYQGSLDFRNYLENAYSYELFGAFIR